MASEVEIGNKYEKNEEEGRLEDEAKGGTETTLMTHFAEAANFICGCSSLLKFFNGTGEELVRASSSLNQEYQYYPNVKSDSKYLHPYRFDPLTATFVECEVLAKSFKNDGKVESFGTGSLLEQLKGINITISNNGNNQTVSIENAINNYATSNEQINEYLVKARIEYFKQHAFAYLDIQDVVFHQCYIKLVAGTDNRSKNTYYWIDPEGNGDTLIRMKQDDLDTVLPTDNQGKNTKPYYVLEHDKDENGTNFWRAENNVLFTLIELAFESNMREMMRSMFSVMASISGNPLQYFEDRFFFVQNYFPAVAYNETGRLLYEYAEWLMHCSVNELPDICNGVNPVFSPSPLTQSLGSQLECEREFVKKRLPMLYGFAEYGDFASGYANDAIVFAATPDNGQNPDLVFTYKAYQYIYPKISVGSTGQYGTDSNGITHSEPWRLAAGDTVTFTIKSAAQDTRIRIQGMSYCSELGDLSGQSVKSESDGGSVIITGKRLRKFIAGNLTQNKVKFACPALTFSGCDNLEEIDLTNVKSLGLSNGIATGSFTTVTSDLPKGLQKLKSLKLGGTSLARVEVPESGNLTTLALPNTLTTLYLGGQPNLSNFDFKNTSKLLSLYLDSNQIGGINILEFTEKVIKEAKELSNITVKNANWKDVSRNIFLKFIELNPYQSASNIEKYTLTGKIKIKDTDSFLFNDKLNSANIWGNIDDINNILYIDYFKRGINSIALRGDFVIYKKGQHQPLKLYSFTK